MRLRLPVLLALLVALVAAPAGAAPDRQQRKMDCQDVGKGLQRCEGDFFVVYTPSGWLPIESSNGVDVVSPTGVYWCGFGFAGWYQPLTFDQILAVAAKYHSFDAHPLARFRFTQKTPVTGPPEHVSQTYAWSAFRTDRRENARGVIAIDLFRNDAAQTYGYDTYALAAPAADFKRVFPTLVFILKHITYHPH